MYHQGAIKIEIKLYFQIYFKRFKLILKITQIQINKIYILLQRKAFRIKLEREREGTMGCLIY